MLSAKTAILLLVLSISLTVQASAIPDPANKRVKEQHLSEHDHLDEDGDHNAEYDHDAFLGEDEAKEFENLSPEESNLRLGLIYDKIDDNHDGKVSTDEMSKWIVHVQQKYLESDANRQWDELQVPGDGSQLAWEHYREKSYGGLDRADEHDPDEVDDAAKMERRDKKRFQRADTNEDGTLDKKEFNMFIHPEEYKEMRDLVVEETLEDIDKDKDGSITMDEYIGDMWTPDGKEEEPDWVERERRNFKEQRDADHDGKMNKNEVYSWVMPDDYDHMEVETKHLMKEADEDKDGFLTKEEVLKKHDLFVGSQATDYGDALQRHDEF